MQIYSEEQAYAILQQIEEEASVNLKPAFIDRSFKAQAKFLKDPAFRKAAQCTRRAGKSNVAGRALFKEAYRYPGSTVLYLALTRASAKNIMWDSVIKQLNKELRLGGDPHETELNFRLPNGSKIQLAGADASHQEMEKYLGGKYPVVFVDEAGSFRQDLRKLIYENLEPAVADYEGWVGMIGTATEITSGLFFEVTNGTEPGWSVHKWMTEDNPYMRVKWAKRIQLLLETNPRVIETPAFQRMYKNLWYIDEESLCYKYKYGRNDIDELPKHIENDLTNVLGVDLGFNDSSAFVIASFTDYHRDLYFREPYKRSGMIISDVAKMIEYYINKYKPMACVIDNASKQAVEELKQRFNLPLEAAEKQGKHQFIEIMNADFIQGHIKLVGNECEPMRKEYGALIWDEDAKPKWKEHPKCENHLCFVAGTMIRTPSGQVPIETLRVDDLVYTRKGSRRIKYTINSLARVVKLQMSDGTSVLCTPDHPFWSCGKWIKAQDLTKTDQLFTWSLLLSQRGLSSKVSPITDPVSCATLERLLVESPLGSIKRYGNLILERSQKVTIFITKIMTTSITALKTSNASLPIPICPITCVLEARPRKILPYWKRSDLLPLHGINLKRVESGTENTRRRVSRSLRQSVHGVMQATVSRILRRIKSVVVLKNASQLKEEQVGSTISSTFVHGVNHHSSLTNTQRENAVVCVAQDSLKDKELVYNLTIEGEHEYFANDLLVSNCDATLYAWRKCFPYLSKAPAPKKNEQERIEEWFDKKAEEYEGDTAKPFWER